MMKNSCRERQKKFILFIVFLFFLSASIALMPFGTAWREKSMVPLIVAGALFWIGLIGTIGMAVRINMSRRASRNFREAYPDFRKLGLIHFFQNKPAIVFDIALFASLIWFIVAKLLNLSDGMQFAAMALIVFAFGMHCMLNGINYIYINYHVRRESAS